MVLAVVVLTVVSRGRFDESMVGSVVVLSEPKAKRCGPDQVLFFRSSADDKCSLQDALLRWCNRDFDGLFSWRDIFTQIDLFFQREPFTLVFLLPWSGLFTRIALFSWSCAFT